MGASRLLIGQFLQVVGQDQCADPAFTDGRAHGAVEQVAHLGGHAGLFDEGAGDVLEQ